MARHSLSSAFPPALRRLFQGTPDRRSRRGTGRGSSPSRPAGLSRRVRPRLEALEDRVTPSTFTTTTFADDGTAGSLRGALAQANSDTGTATDTIQLQAGTYQLTIANAAGRHEQGNAQGDLNVTGTRHALVIRGTTDAQGNPTTTITRSWKVTVVPGVTTWKTRSRTVCWMTVAGWPSASVAPRMTRACRVPLMFRSPCVLPCSCLPPALAMVSW